MCKCQDGRVGWASGGVEMERQNEKRQRGKERDWKKDRQTPRQTDTQTDRHPHRQTPTQTDRLIETERELRLELKNFNPLERTVH